MNSNTSSIVCFFGTNKNITPQQELSILDKLSELSPIKEFRHCDVIGSTERLHEVILKSMQNIIIRIFPHANNVAGRAFCAAKKNVIIEEELTLANATKLMCKDADILLAAPSEDANEFSHTNKVIEIAKKNNIRKIIIYSPNGTITTWPDMSLMPKRKVRKNNEK